MLKTLYRGLLLTMMVTSSAVQSQQSCQPESIAASTPDSQLIDNGNGTITDSMTGLMWKQCSEGQSGNDCATGSAEGFTWQLALQRVQEINISGFAGYTDWRVPNIKELSSLVDHQCSYPSINLARFPNTPAMWYWSASATAGLPGNVWYVYFGNGYINWSNNQGGYQLRLVRSITSGPGIELIDDGTRTEPSDVDTTPEGVSIQPVSSEPLPAQGSTTVSGSVGTDGLPTSPAGNFN